MDVRKVQKSGDMHYVYLPTSWCKKHGISSQKRVNLQENNNGALVISPASAKEILKNLVISLGEEDQDVINKLIVACYINPLGSFKINLDKEITANKLLNQKNIVALESVEIEKKTISCDSTTMLSSPVLLFKTMVRKIKNLIVVMREHYNEELINRYEEEIDRSRMHIQKSIISYMTYSVPVNLRMIDLYYISLLTTDLERAVDYIIKLPPKERRYMKQLMNIIDVLKNITDSFDQEDSFSYKLAIEFVKTVRELKASDHYDKKRIVNLLDNISEILLDWGITNQIEK